MNTDIQLYYTQQDKLITDNSHRHTKLSLTLHVPTGLDYDLATLTLVT